MSRYFETSIEVPEKEIKWCTPKLLKHVAECHWRARQVLEGSKPLQ
jgi:hypothetical protein